MRDAERAGDRAFERAANPADAGARRPSEGLTLAVAVAVAVGFGVAFGIWLNARLAPTSSDGTTRSARLLPDARPSVPPASPAPAARPSPCDGCETSPVSEAAPARGPAGKADEAGPGTDSVLKTGGAREEPSGSAVAPRRADEVANTSAEPHGPKGSEAVAAASPHPSRPVAWEVSPLPKAGGRAAARANVEHGAAQSGKRGADGGAQGQPKPCGLYASASSLRVRLGGAVPLILGGPGEGVRINVGTPDWAQLAIIYEGPAAGHNGWLSYSVRSVGHRPGLYTVRFSTSCGSQSIPVTVN